MRIVFKKSEKPKPGTQRVKTFFAILPVMIDNELRWLRRVKVMQEYQTYFFNFAGSSWEAEYEWVNIKFIDEPKPEQ